MATSNRLARALMGMVLGGVVGGVVAIAVIFGPDVLSGELGAVGSGTSSTSQAVEAGIHEVGQEILSDLLIQTYPLQRYVVTREWRMQHRIEQIDVRESSSNSVVADVRVVFTLTGLSSPTESMCGNLMGTGDISTEQVILLYKYVSGNRCELELRCEQRLGEWRLIDYNRL